MNYYVLIMASLFVFNCSNTENVSISDRDFSEIGIIGFAEENNKIEFDIYLLNHKNIRGVQLKLDPANYMEIKEVQSERLKNLGFDINHNKTGTILAFSFSGKEIPVSKTTIKKENILFSIKANRLKSGDFKVNLNPLLAVSNSGKTEKVETKEVEFEWTHQ